MARAKSPNFLKKCQMQPISQDQWQIAKLILEFKSTHPKCVDFDGVRVGSIFFAYRLIIVQCEGDCEGTDSRCIADHICGNDNCDKTPSNAEFGLNQKFDCCIPKAGIFIWTWKKAVRPSILTLYQYLISGSRSLQYHDPEKGIQACEDADAYPMVKRIGKYYGTWWY